MLSHIRKVHRYHKFSVTGMKVQMIWVVALYTCV